MLKLNFYQLDRLIAIILPDLHTHFKQESITSSYFSAPYFITVFTSILQMQTHMRNCEALLRLWDYFIVVSGLILLNTLVEWAESHLQSYLGTSQRERGTSPLNAV
jgi:hypothetical protein